jgi:hypothetical protein
MRLPVVVATLLLACRLPTSPPPDAADAADAADAPDAPDAADAADAPEEVTCKSGASPCSASEQCCSGRCDLSRGAGLCGGLELLAGPLVSLPAALRDSDFRLNPPLVEEVLAKRGTTGGTAYMVRFAKDQRLAQTVTLQPSKGALTLRDDGKDDDDQAGDGLFTALLPLDFEAVRAANKTALERIVRSGKPVPIFGGREIVGTRKFDPELSGDRIRIVTDLPPLDLTDHHNSLMVTHLGVVGDPGRTRNPCTGAGTAMGKWTFGYLMQQMANQAVSGIDPAEFTLQWIRRWQTAQPVGISSTTPALGNLLETVWPKLPDGRLDLAQAPFQLLAIVNRIDLAGNPSYGAVGGAEGRFVFQLKDTTACTSTIFPFLVILEYGVPRHGCEELRSWAQLWVALESLTIGTPAYNAALEAITEQFVVSNADPTKVNGSAINQVRTNDPRQPSGSAWELREFKLTSVGGVPALRAATLKQTPSLDYNAADLWGAREGDLASWINANQSRVIAQTHAVPAVYPSPPGGDFLAASIRNDIGDGFWHTPHHPIVPPARFGFSLNTCNACHGPETGTTFAHIGGFLGPAPGAEASLSGFLTGITVTDPVDLSIQHHFNDLAFRSTRLHNLAESFCGPFLSDVLFANRAFPFPPILNTANLMSH